MRISAFAALAALLSLVASVGGGRAEAHDFFAPNVRPYVTTDEPGAHPDLQVHIDVPEGAGFDQVRIVAPAGSQVGADDFWADGTVVGRLEATATTNAITRPTCDQTVSYTVPIIEATTDVDSPAYPPYLRDLAPGRHRLRLVADVSPAPALPILINFLFDYDEDGRLVTQVFVGDVEHPLPNFKVCAPQSSVSTLFGVVDGLPLLTSPEPRAAEPQPFTYTFTSRPDDDGHRHERTVEAFAETPPPPVQPSNIDLRMFGATGQVGWSYPGLAEEFVVEAVMTPRDGGDAVVERASVSGGRREFTFEPRFVPAFCAVTVYRVAAVVGDVVGPFAESGEVYSCVEGPDDPALSCAPINVAYPPDAVPPPYNVRIGRDPDGTVVLKWEHRDADIGFEVWVCRAGASEPEILEAEGNSLAFPGGVLPECPSDEPVAVRIFPLTHGVNRPAELSFAPCAIAPGGVVFAPDTGFGVAAGSDARAALVTAATALVAGSWAVVVGWRLRRVRA